MIASTCKAAARVGHHLVRPARSSGHVGVGTTGMVMQQGQVRFHHPDPFNPTMTKGWKAAQKVNDNTRLKQLSH
jgi:hypothetical protein